MYYLYVKTHNETGLKYFGYTESENPHEYRGSGKKWKRHIKKYGYDVTTKIIFSSEDRDITKQKALFYSEFFDIVISNEWANLTIEQLEGGFTHINNSEEIRKKATEKKRLNGWFAADKNPMFGKKHSEDVKKKHSERMAGSNNPNYNKKLSESTKKKMSESKKQYWLKRKEGIVNGD